MEKIGVPLKSKIGNKVISCLIYKKSNIKLHDTQTGLRAIPKKYLYKLIQVEGNKYEYETNVILYCAKNNIDIIEEEVECTYINNNNNTKYKPIKDSIRIIKSVIF